MQSVEHIEHQWIPMADGVRLSARLWLPKTADAGPVPAILEYIPYRKRDMVRMRDEHNHPVFARAGYAAIRVDMRGSGDSEGSMHDMYMQDELDDAITVIEWIARQSWCNEKVGMMGTSWGGTSSLQTASRKPAALKAIIAVCATNNRYDDDIHHMGGCMLTDSIEWGATLPAILASPPDPQTVGDGWRHTWQQRLQELRFPLEHWIAHETRDSYWRHGSVNEQPDAIACPVLMVGGWSDRYSNTVMNLLADVPDNTWGIVGPWGHHYPDQAAPGPGINFQQEALRWWDHWLRGVENDVPAQPQLRVWMQEYTQPENELATRPGYWTAEKTWPSANIETRTLCIDDATLQWTHERFSEQPGELCSIPDNLLVGRAAGDTGYFGRTGGLPLDQGDDDRHSLVFETAPLDAAVEIIGRVNLGVTLRRQQRTATLVARINDVHPNGSVARVCLGVRNLALNENGELAAASGSEQSELNQRVDLAFPNTAYRFKAGHKIRIALSSSYWPIIWPTARAARLSLLTDSLQLALPVRTQTDAIAISFSQPDDTTAPTSCKLLSAPPLQRKTTVAAEQAVQSTGWHQPLHCVYYPDINLEFGFETDAQHDIDPADRTSAISRFEHTLHFGRDDWNVNVTCSASLTATETQYKVSGSITITENGSIVFTRNWNPVIERTCS